MGNLRFLILCCFLLLAQPSWAGSTIFLTFDDGPLRGTAEIVEILEGEQIPATFFLVGKHVNINAQHRALFAKIKNNPLFLVGNHSYNHAYDHYKLFYRNPAMVFEDFIRNNLTLGLPTAPFPSRLPGRNDWRLPGIVHNDPYILTVEVDPLQEERDVEILARHGFLLYGWDLEWAHDARGIPIQTPAEMVQAIDAKLAGKRSTAKHGKLVLLAHDIMFRKGVGDHLLRELIVLLRERGFAFETLRTY